MDTLTRASEELFRRSDDETFDSLDSLYSHCQKRREGSREVREYADKIMIEQGRDSIGLGMGGETFDLNDWSFSQVCWCRA